jgi:O-Antigen ligase
VASRATVVLLILAFVTALFIWWEWKQGAYFGQIFYPGAIGVFALVGLLAANVPISLRVRGPFGIALLGLIGICFLTFLSLIWTDVPAAPVAYGERIAVYVALAGIGAWAARSLGPRMHLALVPVAVSGAVVGVATAIVLGTGTDVSWYLQGDATLRFPIGYRNADVAFLLICLWPLVSLATCSWFHWAFKALAVAAGTVLVDLAVLGQSRGSIPALAIACVVFIAITPNRLRGAAVLALIGVPVLTALSSLLGVFRYGSPDAGAVAPLHHAAAAIGWSAGISLVLAAIALGLLDPRLRLGRSTVRGLSWLVGVGVAVAVIGAGTIFVGRHGGPIHFIDQRVEQFGKTGYPNLHEQGVRFGANIGSNRHDFWRVAVDEGLEKPVTGGGAGSFQLAYLRHRKSLESPHDPHSIEAVIFSELGFPGFILLIVFVVAGIWAVVRSARAGPLAASMAAGAAAAAAQWFVHGSFDWFWQYAAVTGLGIYMLGVAAGPGLEVGGVPWSRAARSGIAVIAVVLALVAVPLFISSSYLSRGIDRERSKPAEAISDFHKAAQWNPLDDEPLLLRGLVEANHGDSSAALKSFQEASEREPESYASYLFAAETLLPKHLKEGTEALARAAELNPREPAIRQLERSLSHRP